MLMITSAGSARHHRRAIDDDCWLAGSDGGQVRSRTVGFSVDRVVRVTGPGAGAVPRRCMAVLRYVQASQTTVETHVP